MSGSGTTTVNFGKSKVRTEPLSAGMATASKASCFRLASIWLTVSTGASLSAGARRGWRRCPAANGHRVERRQESAEARVDDAGGEKQPERVGRDAKQIQQEWHRRSRAAVNRPVSASRGYSVTGTAASANHPANRMKL